MVLTSTQCYAGWAALVLLAVLGQVDRHTLWLVSWYTTIWVVVAGIAAAALAFVLVANSRRRLLSAIAAIALLAMSQWTLVELVLVRWSIFGSS